MVIINQWLSNVECELSDVSSEQDLGHEGVVQPLLDFFQISNQKRHELNQLFGIGRFGLEPSSVIHLGDGLTSGKLTWIWVFPPSQIIFCHQS